MLLSLPTSNAEGDYLGITLQKHFLAVFPLRNLEIARKLGYNVG
jgi:hypothetical protein